MLEIGRIMKDGMEWGHHDANFLMCREDKHRFPPATRLPGRRHLTGKRAMMLVILSTATDFMTDANGSICGLCLGMRVRKQ